MGTGLAPTEIIALARILDELDYYQLLHLEPGAPAGAVRKAFHATSRAFHPDANRHLDSGERAAVDRIAKRVTEAYTVLRDPRRRKAYDQARHGGGGVRMQIAEADAVADQHTAEVDGTTPNGRKFAALARTDLQRGDVRSAIRNLQMALTFEPANPHLKARLAELKGQKKP